MYEKNKYNNINLMHTIVNIKAPNWKKHYKSKILKACTNIPHKILYNLKYLMLKANV